MTPDLTTNGHKKSPSVFCLSLFKNKFDKTPKRVERSWGEICERIAKPQIRAEKDGPLFAPALFDPPARKKENVKCISELVLDYDHGADFDIDLEVWRMFGLSFAAYTTHSSYRETESNPDAEERFRVIIPLLEPIPAGEFPKLWRWAAEVAQGRIDEQAKDASRMFYTPAVPEEGARYRYEIHEGELLDWRAIKLEEDEQQPPPARNTKPVNTDAYGQAALQAEVNAVLLASTGERNAQLNKSAFALGQLVGGGVLYRSDVESALERAAVGAGLDKSEIRNTIRSGIDAGMREPRRAPEKPRLQFRVVKPETPPEVEEWPGEIQSEEIDTVFDDEDLLADHGNAARFLNAYRQTTKYVYARKKFMSFDGKRWSDDQGIVEDRANKVVQGLRHIDAITLEAQEKAFKHYVASQKPERRNAILTLIRAEVRIECESFDANPELFNVSNGTVDLATGELLPHDPARLCMKLSKVEYQKDAKCPKWLRFLIGVFNKDKALIRFIQKAVGYSLSGLSVEQVFFLLYGVGRNGKTTFINVLSRLIGEYATHAQMEVFTAKNRSSGGHNEDLARLCGARLITAIETEESKRLSEALIKQITGGDPVTASYKHEHSITFTPVFKLWLPATHTTGIGGTDEGIWRRPLMIPFLVQFEKDTEKAKRDNLKIADKFLENKLMLEVPGILNWAFEGYRLWKTEGLTPPQQVREATEQYRKDSDVLGMFIEQRLEQMPDKSQRGAVAGQIYKAYCRWCEDNGEYVLNQTRFGNAMSERGFVKRKESGNVYYFGVILTYQDSQDSQDRSTGYYSRE